MLKTRCQADPRQRDNAAKLSSGFRTCLCLCLCLGLSPTLVQAIENALHSTYRALAFPARLSPCAVYIYCIEAEQCLEQEFSETRMLGIGCRCAKERVDTRFEGTADGDKLRLNGFYC
jgi:hypothetical protein